MTDLESLLSAIDAASEEFSNRVRYVIRGKKGTQLEGLAYGCGMVDEQSDMVFLYNEKWQAEMKLAEFAKAMKQNTGLDASELVEIREVHKDELFTTFRKAHTI